jgi:hypothetical protein
LAGNGYVLHGRVRDIPFSVYDQILCYENDKSSTLIFCAQIAAKGPLILSVNKSWPKPVQEFDSITHSKVTGQQKD